MKRRHCFALLLLLSLSGCIGAPTRWGAHKPTLRSYCKLAAEQGWCSARCGKKQPTHCQPLTLLSCGEVFCVSKAPDGSLVFHLKRRPRR
jgi:hypothetical protein